jgi:ubiquinone biosynthesis protein
MIISAIIVASSLITQTNMKPLLWGVPLLGVFGFLLASIFGMWLVFNIFGTGRI